MKEIKPDHHHHGTTPLTLEPEGLSYSMLHQTFPLFLPKFNHFSSSATTNPPPPPPPPITSSSQVKPEEMECVEAKALKTSCWPEMGLKSVQQEELILGGGNGIPNCVQFGDDSFVDDLLDFPKEDQVEEDDDDDKFIVEEEEEEEEKDSISVSSHEQNSNCSSDVSVKDEFGSVGSVPGSELCVPADDLADLEWLSHFVEDSFTEFSFPYPSGTPTEKTQTQTPTPIPNTNTNTNTKTNRYQLPVCSGIPFPSPVPAKARSKRSRTNRGRVWSLGSPSFSESTITTTSSSSYSSPSSSSSNSCLIFTNSSSQNLDLFYYPSSKKQRKKKSQTEPTQNQRRCSHCGVQKTPQWRTGPLGAKTLCNACGVRFKSGRLLPEYRPACSPTFSSDVHSNNHRKVLEMRRKKDTGVPDSGTLSPAVHSF